MTADKPEMEISLATTSDVLEIQDLMRCAFAKYVDRIGREPAPMTDDYALLIQSEKVYVARYGTQLVGVIALENLSDHLHIFNVGVAPDAQGLGLGTALLNFAEARAKADDLPEMRLYTNVKMHENLGYYLNRGFVEVDRRSEDGYDRVYFSRPLSHSSRA